MNRILLSLTSLLLLSSGARAATTNTTLTVKANATLSGTSITVTGTADLSGIGTALPFTATAGLTNVDASGNANVPFTITLSNGTLKGTLSIPSTVLVGAGSGEGSATITGGTGSYADATGSFPKLTGTATGNITTSVALTFTGAGTITTGGGGTTPPPTSNAPTITAVLDAASYTKNIAQGSIFVVKGTNLSAAGFTQFQFPLPTASASGIKITFTPAAGGTGTDAYLVYLYNENGVNQLAGILPSTVAAGNYNVTVTNGPASAGFAAAVVQRKAGIITQDSSGSGLAVVQNFISQSQLDVNRFTSGAVSGVTISPARPGQVLIAWLTGMGPVTGGDNTASAGFNFAANGVDVKVIVGGVSITPLYAGRAPGLAGADQINFALPADAPTGCTVSFQVSVNGQLSNPTFIAIAPNTAAGACVAPGFTATQLQQFDQGGSYTLGAFTISQISQTVPQLGTVKINAVGGSFTKITGFQLSTAAQYVAPATGACQVLHVTGGQNELTSPIAATNLDAGNITLTGPTGSGLTNAALNKDAASNAYALSLGMEGLPAGTPGLPGSIAASIVQGTYQLNGAGGKDVGAFTASVTLGAPLTITNGMPSVITRANGLPLAWTGGNASDVVTIMGYSGQNVGTGANATVDATEFICTTTAGQGGFTVPSSVLLQLPAVSASAITNGTGAGFLEIVSSTGNGTFKAPLTAGSEINNGIFQGVIGIGSLPSYQ